MKRNKIIFLFFFKFIILYGIFLIIYPGIKESFRNIIIAEDNFFLGKMDGANSEFVFSPYSENKTEIRIVMVNLRRTAAEVNAIQVKFDSLYMAYIPFALLISLIIASSGTLKRKIFAVATGVFIVNVFIIFKTVILMYYICNNSQPNINLLTLSSLKLDVISFICTMLVEPLPPTLIFVALTWILLMFKKDDFILKSGSSQQA